MILHNAGSRSSSHQGALSAGLSALAQPFKLRMARSPHETQLWDYSTNVVLIEPLASLQAVEDFLWPRVFRTNPPPEARGGANAAAAQSAATARKSSRSTSTRSKCGKGEEQVCCLLAVTCHYCKLHVPLFVHGNIEVQPYVGPANADPG